MSCCGSYRKVKLPEHAMKIVERVLERRIRTLINLNKMQFRFMSRKGIVDAIFIARRMQEDIKKKRRNCTCVLLTWKKLLIGCQEK